MGKHHHTKRVQRKPVGSSHWFAVTASSTRIIVTVVHSARIRPAHAVPQKITPNPLTRRRSGHAQPHRNQSATRAPMSPNATDASKNIGGPDFRIQRAPNAPHTFRTQTNSVMTSSLSRKCDSHIATISLESSPRPSLDQAGIEPATPALQMRCSAAELLAHRRMDDDCHDSQNHDPRYTHRTIQSRMFQCFRICVFCARIGVHGYPRI